MMSNLANVVIDTSAPIIPGKSLGGIKIRVHISELAKQVKLGLPDTSFAGTDDYPVLDSDGAITVGVHHDTGIVFRISALEGYKGILLGKYSVGMPVDLVLSDHDWWFSEEFGVMESLSHPGVAICIEVFDPDPGDLPGKMISEISIYDEDDPSVKSALSQP